MEIQNMNKFTVFSCLNVDEEDTEDLELEYKGPVVVLSCCSDPSFMLFFPIPEDIAKIIKYVLKSEGDFDINMLGIYKTMIDSWKSGERYLAGVIMDAVYEPHLGEDVLMIRLALANHNGDLDSLIHVNFVHSILLAAMEKVEIIISDKLITKLVPEDEEDEGSGRKEKNGHPFPEDKKLLGIVKEIMSGKIKDGEENENNEDEDSN